MTFEEYDAGISSLDGRTILHKPSKNLWHQYDLIIEGCCIQFLQEGAANSYESETARDFISIGFALDGPSRIKVNGVKFNDRKLALLRPGDSIATHAVNINNYCIISFPVGQFLNACKNYDPQLEEQVINGSSILDIQPTGCRKILNHINEIEKATRTSYTFSSKNARELAVEELLAITFDTLSLPTIAEKTSGRPRFPLQVTIKRIREYLSESQGHPTSVAEMARHVGISERKLRQDIRMLFGVSPVKLLSLSKIRNIRLSLINAKPGQTVTEILFANSVWETGRFAAAYHNIFNEYPSDTIKSNN